MNSLEYIRVKNFDLKINEFFNLFCTFYNIFILSNSEKKILQIFHIFVGRLLLYEYTAADAWPMAGVEPLTDFNEFNNRIVRGNPTHIPRVEAVPIRMPFPKAPYQGSIYENQRTLTNNYFDHQVENKRAEGT